ncbi:MAG: sigma 54-interacting transcriptional regulator [Planctomycetes bacterium]|nr:sigma 54-interacting transcriptional regulator [Planctomycetota bacterium]
MKRNGKPLEALLALTGVFTSAGNLDDILAEAFRVLERESGFRHLHLYMLDQDDNTLALAASSRPAVITKIDSDHPLYGAFRSSGGFTGYVGRMGTVVAVPLFLGRRVSGIIVAAPLSNRPDVLEESREVLSVVAHFFGQALAIHRNAQLDKEELVAENYSLLEEANRGHRVENIVFVSGAMQEVVDRAIVVARSDADVLIMGETGTGKELLAGLVHYHSARGGKPLVRVNCAALPPALLESELFGHVRGAFTGAVSDRKGRFAAADGGCLFLDEITQIPLELQPKLLRALQEREFEPVGSSLTVSVNLRIIAATNLDLEKETEEGRFRKDLFYRLNVVPIVVPPLRKRPSDIPALVEFFMHRASRKNFKAVQGVTADALEVCTSYPWPGNVRELENAVEHAVVLADGPLISVEHLPIALKAHAAATPAQAAPLDTVEDTAVRALQQRGSAREAYLRSVERVLFAKALDIAHGNRTDAAALLGVSRNTLARRLSELGLT